MQASETRYAIGVPGQLARCYVTDTLEGAMRQVVGAEVAVLVPLNRTGPTFLAADGVAGAPPAAVALPAITTAVQLPTTIPVPAGARWLAKGAAFTGPQDISFAAPGDYVVKMDGRWMGAGTVTVLSAADYRTWLIGLVDDEAERRKMLVLTPGGAKKMEYDAKRAEVEAYFSLGGSVAAIATALLNLTTEQRARRFRYANAEVAITGASMTTVMARFQAGADANQNENARLSAIAQKAKIAIRAAASSAAALTAYRTVNWNAA